MTPLRILVINVVMAGLIVGLPTRSITWANRMVETGLLAGVGAPHLVTFPDAVHNLGISWPNIATIAGLFIVINTLIRLVSEVRSTPNGPQMSI